MFVLTWEGTGTVQLLPSINDGVGEHVLSSTPNRIVLRMDTPFEYEIVRITRSAPDDPVRGLRLWAPERDGAGLALTDASDLRPGHVEGSLEPLPGAPEPRFHPIFLDHLRQAPDAGVLRFLGWLTINGITDERPVTWADRGDPDAAVQGLAVIDGRWGRHPVPAFRDRLGYPYEWLVALCNETGRDLWLQVPHTATPELAQALAVEVARTLRPELRVWAEFSNELWNAAPPYMPQRRRAMARAAEHFGVDEAAVDTAHLAWGAGRLQAEFLRTFEDAWREAGQSDARLVNVASGFAAVPEFNRGVLESMREVDPTLPEVLAVSNYFGHDTQGEVFALHPFGAAPGAWPDALFEATASTVRRTLHEAFGAWAQSGRIAQDLGLPMVSYEGGQHMLPFGYGDRTNPAHVDFMDFLFAFQRSARMGALYREQYALWSAAGGRTPSLWMDLGTWSFWGTWGAKEYVTQTRGESPKWDAFCGWGETQRGVRAPHDALGTRPVMTPARQTGEAGRPFDGVIEALGGDGPVALSLLGGALPPGLTLRDEGFGHARIAGTPSRAGVFRAVLRARDADGDVDDARLEITIDPAGLAGHAMLVFRGTDLPASVLPDGTPNGRYDPTRPTERLDGGARLCVPFSPDAPLFATEFLGSGVLPATGPLAVLGGWCARALEGSTRVGPAELSSWTGLRERQFMSWIGDLAGPSSFDAVLLWPRAQFEALGGTGRHAFGADASTATLQADLTGLVGDGKNELHFVVVDREGGTDVWYLSEAAWRAPFLGDGVFRIEDFSGSSLPGRRFARIEPPTGTEVSLPTTGLVFGPVSFDDVQAVGLFYRGTRWRWHHGFAFRRFFALGERR